jgi:hypothetical protein
VAVAAAAEEAEAAAAREGERRVRSFEHFVSAKVGLYKL